MNIDNLQYMIKVSNAILNVNTSDELKSIVDQLKPEQLNFCLNALRFTNDNENFPASGEYPQYSVGQEVVCPYYSIQYDAWTGNSYKKTDYVKAQVTAISRDVYYEQSFYNEYLYTVRYENGTSRGNFFEHALSIPQGE